MYTSATFDSKSADILTSRVDTHRNDNMIGLSLESVIVGRNTTGAFNTTTIRLTREQWQEVIEKLQKGMSTDDSFEENSVGI